MNWKGSKVQYGAIHQWIRNRKYKPKKCQICKKEYNEYGNNKLQLANLSGYYQRDLNDWIYCHSGCHKKEHQKGNHKNIKFKEYLEEIVEKRKYDPKQKKYQKKYQKEYINKFRPIISIKRKKHRQEPEIRLYIKNYAKEYGQRLEVIKQRRINEKKYYQRPENKLKKLKYNQLPKRKRYAKNYYKTHKKERLKYRKEYRKKNRPKILLKKKITYQEKILNMKHQKDLKGKLKDG